jgi:cytochrome c oxidase subunit 3
MPGTDVTEEVEIQEGSPGGPGGASGAGGDGGDGTGGTAPAIPQRIYLTGMTMALAAILMFFTALTSAYIVRKGLSRDWQAIELPRILWLNTFVLLASSVTIERARRQFARGQFADFRYWWGISMTLGGAFFLGQLIAWRQLAAIGTYLKSNPSSSFFYVLTGAHGLHLVGGIIALAYVGWRSAWLARVRQGTAVEVAAVYWHFLDGLWIFLFLLLSLGR